MKKTIVETATGLSKYIFEDAAEIVMSPDNIVTPDFIIGDLNAVNATLHENVTPPEDWQGNRYTFDGTTWEVNPDWVDPATLEDEGE
jgi:hypothetical protein